MLRSEFEIAILAFLSIAAMLVSVVWVRDRLRSDFGRRLDRLEERLTRMDGLLRKLATNSNEHPSTDRPQLSDPSPEPPQGLALRPTGRTIRPDHTGVSQPTLISVPDLSGASPTVGTQAEAVRRASLSGELAQRFRRIWSMADEGASADRIARAIGQPVGQVELVLNLRRILSEENGSREPLIDEVSA